jgi:hypothetical protein
MLCRGDKSGAKRNVKQAKMFVVNPFDERHYYFWKGWTRRDTSLTNGKGNFYWSLLLNNDHNQCSHTSTTTAQFELFPKPQSNLLLLLLPGFTQSAKKFWSKPLPPPRFGGDSSTG